MTGSTEVNIAGLAIRRGQTPFVIAEISRNHNQSLEQALVIVEAAAKASAHALKIRTRTPDTMTLNLNERELHISDPTRDCRRAHHSTSCMVKPKLRGNGTNPCLGTLSADPDD